MSNIVPDISVVVIGRNEGERLKRCLQSIQLMEPLPNGFELIYVDSGSSDSSVNVATSLGATVIELRSTTPTAAMARNAGWRAARAEWILFLDGDTVLHPAFPGVALQAAYLSSVAAVWGHRRELHPRANFFHRVLDLDWVYAPGFTPFCGGDALVRRQSLEIVDGFDETLIAGEEPELCSRFRAIGYSILHIDEPMTTHDLAIRRFGQYWRRASRAGYAYAKMAERTKQMAIHLWADESKANAVRALALTAMLLLALLKPTLIAIVLSCLVLRTAWKARWKDRSRVSLLCYGIHSHFQQIPIFAGQLSYWFDAVRNRQRGLIEYK